MAEQQKQDEWIDGPAPSKSQDDSAPKSQSTDEWKDGPASQKPMPHMSAAPAPLGVMEGLKQVATNPKKVAGGAVEELWNNLNPVAIFKTAFGAARHPIDTAKALYDAQNQTFEKAKDSFQHGEYADAAVHGLNAVLPVIGPHIDNIVQQMADTGDYATGFGKGMGMGLTQKVLDRAPDIPHLAEMPIVRGPAAFVATSPNVQKALGALVAGTGGFEAGGGMGGIIGAGTMGKVTGDIIGKASRAVADRGYRPEYQQIMNDVGINGGKTTPAQLKQLEGVADILTKLPIPGGHTFDATKPVGVSPVGAQVLKDRIMRELENQKKVQDAADAFGFSVKKKKR